MDKSPQKRIITRSIAREDEKNAIAESMVAAVTPVENTSTDVSGIKTLAMASEIVAATSANPLIPLIPSIAPGLKRLRTPPTSDDDNDDAANDSSDSGDSTTSIHSPHVKEKPGRKIKRAKKEPQIKIGSTALDDTPSVRGSSMRGRGRGRGGGGGSGVRGRSRSGASIRAIGSRRGRSRGRGGRGGRGRGRGKVTAISLPHLLLDGDGVEALKMAQLIAPPPAPPARKANIHSSVAADAIVNTTANDGGDNAESKSEALQESKDPKDSKELKENQDIANQLKSWLDSHHFEDIFTFLDQVKIHAVNHVTFHCSPDYFKRACGVAFRLAITSSDAVRQYCSKSYTGRHQRNSKHLRNCTTCDRVLNTLEDDDGNVQIDDDNDGDDDNDQVNKGDILTVNVYQSYCTIDFGDRSVYALGSLDSSYGTANIHEEQERAWCESIYVETGHSCERIAHDLKMRCVGEAASAAVTAAKRWSIGEFSPFTARSKRIEEDRMCKQIGRNLFRALTHLHHLTWETRGRFVRSLCNIEGHIQSVTSHCKELKSAAKLVDLADLHVKSATEALLAASEVFHKQGFMHALPHWKRVYLGDDIYAQNAVNELNESDDSGCGIDNHIIPSPAPPASIDTVPSALIVAPAHAAPTPAAPF